MAVRRGVPPGNYILVTFKVYEDGDQFTAECAGLGVASCGDTQEEALENVRDVGTYLDTLEDLGERALVFRKRGIKIRKGRRAKIEVEVARTSATLAEMVPV